MICVLKKGNSHTKSLPYTSLVHPILEYGAVCCDLYKEGPVDAFNLVQMKEAKFANHKNESAWETLAQRGKIARICTLFKAYPREGT